MNLYYIVEFGTNAPVCTISQEVYQELKDMLFNYQMLEKYSNCLDKKNCEKIKNILDYILPNNKRIICQAIKTDKKLNIFIDK